MSRVPEEPACGRLEGHGPQRFDSAENNTALYDDHGIKPVIDTRALCKTKKFETLFPNRYDVFCYDESGKVYCSCPSERRGEDELRELAFVGFEHHTIRGKAKMEMRVTLALVVMLAMALGRIQIGQADKMRSLVAPIDRAA